MNDELYFLRSSLNDRSGYRWSLRVVKVSESVPSAYLVFRTKSLAENAAEKGLSVVAFLDLDSTHYFNFAATPVVLFETADEVKSWKADRGAYPYEKHLFRCSPELGLSRVA